MSKVHPIIDSPHNENENLGCHMCCKEFDEKEINDGYKTCMCENLKTCRNCMKTYISEYKKSKCSVCKTDYKFEHDEEFKQLLQNVKNMNNMNNMNNENINYVSVVITPSLDNSNRTSSFK